MQEDFLKLMQRLAPDLAQEMARRALVLERIAALEPVGRRQLAAKLHMTEREVRAVAESLREQGFIRLDASGMMCTPEAAQVLPTAREFSRAMLGLTDMETQLAGLLGVKRVCIVPGDADKDPQVIQEVGRVAAQRVRGVLHNGSTIAVTGGSTVAVVARHMSSPTAMNVMVVPARGGMGRTVETQANTIAAEMAARLGGHHRLIHLPDHMDEAARQEMLKLPEVAEVMALIQRADVILHGIGRADTAMRQGKMTAAQVRAMEKQGAAGECFGSYFDREGNCLLKSSSVGVDLARLSPSCQMIAAAAGAGKAEAMIAVMRHDAHTLLVTDEGAARRMLDILQS